MKSKARTHRTMVALLTACLLAPQLLWAQGSVHESPSAGRMAGDLLVARPVGLVMTVAGTAAFIVSLPFTLLAGSASQAAETLMIGPAETTFVRCLGCTNSGYTNIDVERNRSDDDQ